MPKRSARGVPSYRRHKPSGQARVTLDGRTIYLGRYGSRRSRAEYDRLIGEWLAAGRSLPLADPGCRPIPATCRSRSYGGRTGRPLLAIGQALLPRRHWPADSFAGPGAASLARSQTAADAPAERRRRNRLRCRLRWSLELMRRARAFPAGLCLAEMIAFLPKESRFMPCEMQRSRGSEAETSGQRCCRPFEEPRIG